MPTPFPPRQAAPTSWSGAATTKSTTHNSEWRCTRCDKLLGVFRDGRMHLRFSHGHEYFAGLPIEAICRGCTTLNRFSGSPAVRVMPQR